MPNEKLNMYGLNRLPSFPQVIVKILEILQDELVDVGRLAKLIEMDGPLSVKLLTAANSPIYRRHQQVRSIREAINHMGWDMVKTLALSTAMHQIVNDLSTKERFDLTSFWRHSLYAAVIGKQIAARMQHVSEDEAYLSGLLHDIGRLALRVNYPNQYKHLYESKQNESLLQFEESRIFGSNHSEIGSWIVEDWQISSFLQDSIAFHHKPAEVLEQTTTLVRIVHLAASMSESYPHILTDQLKNGKEWFDLSFEDIDQIFTESNLQVHSMAASLNISIEDESLETGVATEEPLWNARPQFSETTKKTGKNEVASLKTNKSEDSNSVMQPDTTQSEQAEPLEEDFSLATHFTNLPTPELPIPSIVAQTALIDHLEKLIIKEQDDSSFYTSLLHTAWMICGAKQILIFEADMANDKLLGKKTHADQAWVENFSFPLKHDIGLISDALLYRGLTDSFQQQNKPLVNLAEHQLMRLCDAAGMICVPMLLGQKQLGVMVFAMDVQAAREVAKNTFVIKALARIAAIHMNLRNERIANELQFGVEEDNTRKNEMDKFLHETSNPLSTIRNYLEILRIKSSGNESLDQDIRIVNDEIGRVTQLISQFVESSTTPQDQPTNININQTILDVIALHESTYLKPVRIKSALNLASDIPEILCNSYKLRQILINLVKNAAEAMPHGGDLTISTFTEYLPGQKQWILIKIEDSGVGIDEVVRAKIFGSVETTKGGAHKGLGLSIVAELVQGLGGEISFRTATGIGTIFEVRLPCLQV